MISFKRLIQCPLERIPVMWNHFSRVMAGLVPAIYVLLAEAP